MANPKSAASKRPLGSHSLVALIPARAGSKRVPGKNFRELGGKPLLQWSIDSAKACGLFSQIIVSTDAVVGGEIALAAQVILHIRQPAHATDTAHDFLWVHDVMRGRSEEIFAILRPTSPFRTASTIKRAYAELIASEADSIRAIQPVTEHPGKMWRFNGRLIVPALSERHRDGLPFHSSPTQTLPPYFVQNASLEMAWTHVLQPYQTISGLRVAALVTDAVEGFDVNTEADFTEAERIAAALLTPSAG